MGSSRALSTQTDPLQLKLYALHKQARFGSYESCSTQPNGEDACTSESSTPHTAAITGTETSSQVDAWKEIAELPMEDAKREFLKTLFASAPYWKYEQFLLQE